MTCKTLPSLSSLGAKNQIDSVERLGFLSEEARTNLLLNTVDMTVGSWSGTISVAPSRIKGLRASRLTSTASSFGGIFRQSSVATSTNTHSTRFYLKKVDYDYIGFRLGSTKISGGLLPFINLTTLAINLNGVSGITMAANLESDGSIRVDMTTDIIDSFIDIVITNSSGNESGALSIQNVDVSGVQLEEGDSASSYIPTTSAAVTRSVDDMAANLSTVYNNDEGSIYWEGHTPPASATSHSTLFRFDDGTSNNVIRLLRFSNSTNLVLVVTSAGVSDVVTTVKSSLVDGDFIKCAVSYELNNVIVSINGSTALIDTSVNMPIGVDEFNLENEGSGSSNLNERNSSLMYYSQSATEAALNTLTDPEQLLLLEDGNLLLLEDGNAISL